MAVNTQKFLPKTTSEKNYQISLGKKVLAIKPSRLLPSSVNNDGEGGELTSTVSGTLSKEILQMKTKILKLQGVIDKGNKENQKEQEGKRKSKEKEESVKREKKLEGGVKGINIPKITPSLPGSSIVDMIKRFLGFTFLGWLVGKYDELMPKLEKFMSIAKPIFDGLVFVVDAVIKGVFGFVDAGYKAYDTISAGIKKIGGEDAEKAFNDLSKHLNLLLNGAIAAAMLLASTSPGGKPGKPARGKFGGVPAGGSKPNQRLQSYLNRNNQTKLIERRYGNDAAKMYEARRAQGASAQRALSDVKSRFQPLGSQGSLGGTKQGSGVFNRGIAKAPQRAVTKVFGKAAGKTASRFGGKIPVIGPLITLAIRTLVYKEPIAKAAAAAVGMGVGQAIGTFIGGLGAGALGLGTMGLGAVVAPLIVGAGSIIGGMVGEWIGASLYDFIVGFSGKNQKGSRKASGGVVSPKTTQVRKKVSAKKQRIKVVPQKTQPGRDIGGRYKIEQYYGTKKVKPNDPTDERTTGQVIVKQLEKSSTEVKKLPLDWVASLGGAFMDMTLGQKPDRKVSSDIAKSFSTFTDNLLNNELSLATSEITKALVGMANGGSVPQSLDPDVRKAISDKVEKNIQQRLQNIFDQSSNIVLKNFKAVGYEDGDKVYKIGDGLGGGPSGGGGGGAGGYATGAENFVSSGEVYEYLRSKGVSHVHAMGMLANIQAESSFNAGAIGDNGNSGGLFQHHAKRFSGMVSFAGKDWAKNWKRQVDYALREGAGKQYVAKDFKSAEEASAWFTLNFERPSDMEYKARQRLDNLGNFNMDGSWKGGKQPGVEGGVTPRISGSGKKIQVGQSRVSADLEEFRQFRSSEFGYSAKRKPTSSAELYQVRELGIFGSGNYQISPLADDTSYEIEEHRGAGHYENRAFDIPVPNSSAEGDKVAEYWRSRGYTVIWKSQGHYDHVHVEVPANRARDWFKIMKKSDLKPKEKIPPSKGDFDIIIPLDHVPSNLINKIPDKRGGKTYKFARQTGADGREREYTGAIASYVSEKLRKQGYRVRIVAPEDFGNFEDYDNYIANQSKTGATVLPFHLDADPRKGGTGFLARIRKDDLSDVKVAESIAPVLKKYAEIFGGGQRFGGIDSQQNATIDRAAVGPAALLELGSLVTLERMFGKNFVSHPKYKEFLDELTGSIAQTVSKKQSPIKKGQSATLNGKSVSWDGKKWIPKEQYDNTQGWKAAAKRSAQLQADRPWWDKFGFFGGAAAERQRREKSSGKYSFERKNPGATLYNKPQGYTPYVSRFSRKQGGGSASLASNQPTSSYSSLNNSGTLKTETSYNEQMVIMVQKEIIMT